MEIISISHDMVDYINVNLPITKNIYELFLGILNGNIIGYLMIGRDNRGYTIEHIFIDEKYRCRGFGTKLLRSCLDSYKQIKLMVSIENQHAMHIYEKHGFRISHSNARYHVMVK
jgi:ribosomal protein S18 acetylase RimI-like enzyme